MKPYDAATSQIQQDTISRPTPLALKVPLVALGCAGGALGLMVSLDVPGNKLQIAGAIGFGIVFLFGLLSGIGEIRPVAQRALMRAERWTGIDFDGGGVGRSPEQIRFIPVHTSGKVVSSTGSVDQADLRYMIEQLDKKRQTGWTVRQWLGMELPSGREIVATDTGPYAEFIKTLEKCGALVDRTERYKGQLVMDSGEILDCLGL